MLKINLALYELEDIIILSTGKVLLGEAIELTPDEVDEFCEYIISKGGPGSGNFGHAGRPGMRGGSGLGGGSKGSSKKEESKETPKTESKKPEPKKEEPKKEEQINATIHESFAKNEKKRLRWEVENSWSDEDNASRRNVALESLIAVNATTHLMVLKDKDELVGTCAFNIGKVQKAYFVGSSNKVTYHKTDDLHVEFLSTKKGGYGSKFMQNIINHAAKNKVGVDLVSLSESVGFYKALGMKKGKKDAGGNTYFSLSKEECQKRATVKKEFENLEPKSGVFCIPEKEK